jgi:hypothetical protein
VYIQGKKFATTVNIHIGISVKYVENEDFVIARFTNILIFIPENVMVKLLMIIPRRRQDEKVPIL